MSFLDIIIIILITIAVILSIVKILADRRNGKSSCGGDCLTCGGGACSKGEKK